MHATSERPVGKPRVFAVLVGLIGIAYLLPGLWLTTLGGTPYYAVAGLVAAGCGMLLWRGAVLALWLYALLLAGTILWALYESGLNGWALIPRLLGPALFGLWMLIPAFRRKLDGTSSAGAWTVGALALLSLVLIGTGLFPGHQPDLGKQVSMASTAAVLAADPAAADWPAIGNDPGNLRYSPLTQINRDNVDQLKPIWTYRIGRPKISTLVGVEVSPIKIGDGVYLCSGDNDLIRLDAETGKPVWRHEAHDDMTGLFAANCRGVAYYKRPDAAPGAPCAERIVTATNDGRLLAVDAATGRACPDFGIAGQVNVKSGMGDIVPGYFSITSPPQVVAGKLVIGGQIADGQFVGEPSAVIRAYDAVTGRFAWAWDIARPGVHSEPPAQERYAPGMPNSWAPMAADPALGLVYVPMGNATPDYFGGYRTAVMERYSSAIVALDAATGEPRWSFQTTHHDLWDYDLASPPTLADVPGPNGHTIPALIQATKRGEIFMLDRRTGRAIAKVVEKPVPVSNLPGERSSPTQPFSVGLPSFAGPAPSEQRMWGLTPFDQMWCRIRFRQARFEGTMTPVGIDRPTVTWPGYLGGMEWGGVSVDPVHSIMFVNANRVPNYNRLLTRKDADALGVKPIARGEMGYVGGPVAQKGTPYAAAIKPFLSPLGVPCTQPPYGMVGAVDLKSHKLLWERPFGTGRAAGPLGIPSGIPLEMGVPNIGGAVLTGSGLAFIGASQDGYLRALDLKSGREVWRTSLPAGGQTNPITYWSRQSERQFIVIAAGGHGGIMAKSGDFVMAYALPRGGTEQAKRQ